MGGFQEAVRWATPAPRLSREAPLSRALHAPALTLLGLVALTGVAALASGCDTQQACNPNVEDCDDVQGGTLFSGDESIERVVAGCCAPADGDSRCAAEGSWWYDLVVEGSVRTATLTVRQPPAFPAQEHIETHSLAVVQRDPDGFWENRYREIAVVDDEDCVRPGACADQVLPDVSTAFPCLDDAAERWQWRIDLLDRDDVEVACAAWGLAAADWASECLVVEPL